MKIFTVISACATEDGQAPIPAVMTYLDKARADCHVQDTLECSEFINESFTIQMFEFDTETGEQRGVYNYEKSI